MLEDLGHEASEAYSAEAALKILAESPGVELVITDQNMPGMTGLQLAQQIEKQWPDIAIMLATGYAELPPGEGAHLRKLAKPFTQAARARLPLNAYGFLADRPRFVLPALLRNWPNPKLFASSDRCAA